MATLDELRALPFGERIQLVEDLWDTIADESKAVGLSPAQTAELDRRLDDHEENGFQGAVEWSDLKARTRAELDR